MQSLQSCSVYRVRPLPTTITTLTGVQWNNQKACMNGWEHSKCLNQVFGIRSESIKWQSSAFWESTSFQASLAPPTCSKESIDCISNHTVNIATISGPTSIQASQKMTWWPNGPWTYGRTRFHCKQFTNVWPQGSHELRPFCKNCFMQQPGHFVITVSCINLGWKTCGVAATTSVATEGPPATQPCSALPSSRMLLLTLPYLWAVLAVWWCNCSPLPITIRPANTLSRSPAHACHLHTARNGACGLSNQFSTFLQNRASLIHVPRAHWHWSRLHTVPR